LKQSLQQNPRPKTPASMQSTLTKTFKFNNSIVKCPQKYVFIRTTQSRVRHLLIFLEDLLYFHVKIIFTNFNCNF